MEDGSRGLLRLRLVTFRYLKPVPMALSPSSVAGETSYIPAAAVLPRQPNILLTLSLNSG
jgi:hypothetical protein